MNQVTSQQIALYDCDPGGNYTYLVFADGRLRRQDYKYVDALIRQQYPHFEQGGFIEKATSYGSVLRLQMAGGEFCANATRCVGALLAQDYKSNGSLSPLAEYNLLRRSSEKLQFWIEVSGATRPIQIEGKLLPTKHWIVKAEMPIEKAFSNVATNNTTIEGMSVGVIVVRMQGIAHILVDVASLPFSTDPARQSALLQETLNQCGLQDQPAVGLIWYSKQDTYLRIDPVVWVQEINTCIYESACGSGSVALALAKLKDAGNEEATYEIYQPSSQPISVVVAKNTSAQQFLSASISGQVAIKRLPNIKIEISAAALTKKPQVSFVSSITKRGDIG